MIRWFASNAIAANFFIASIIVADIYAKRFVTGDYARGMKATLPMLDVTDTEFDRIYGINVKAIFLAARAVVPEMEKRGGGSIITTASTAGVRPRPGLVWYNSSKGAAITMTKAMAIELAPKNIRVNAINPVAGDTPMLADFMGEDTPEIREKFVSTIPLGRFSQPSDIANAAPFLADPASEFLTGLAIEIDGGRCI